jgi:hypothetical protein
MPREYQVNGNTKTTPAGTPMFSFRPVYSEARTLTAEDNGALCVFNTAAGYTYTLPPAQKGLWFDFMVLTTITSIGAKTICSSGDFLLGTFMQSSDGTFVTVPRDADGTTIVSINMNGTTGGGYKGDWYSVVALSDTQWYIWGFGGATGTEITPFATS